MTRAAHSTGGEGGFALIAVLVVLSILLALAAPFALSMGRGESVAFHRVDRTQVEWGSASARNRLLSIAARGHPSVDPSVFADGLDEYPSALEMPEAFAGLTQGGQLLLAGEVWDLQRKIDLGSASPLLLANLLDLAARLTDEVPPDGDVLPVGSTAAFPDEGFLLVDGELIYYGGRTADAFTNLSRGMLQDLGYRSQQEHTLLADKLVLDYRAVVAVTWPFDERRGGARDQRLPYRSVDELARIEAAGFGGFTLREMDRLRAHATAMGVHEASATWGRAERVFNPLRPPIDAQRRGTRILRVRSGFHIGAGTTVRIRDLQTGDQEYGLVIATQIAGASDSAINLPSAWHLHLLKPVTRSFPAVDTVVEPLVPRPINVNTASDEVLVALMREVRGARFRRLREGEQHVPAPRISHAEARELARRILALRPFESFEDLVERLFEPILEDAGPEQKTRLGLVYRNLLVGRDGSVDMGTAPICFTSAATVGYRAAAAYQRSRVARATAARAERRGIAVAMPGHALDMIWANQLTMEEAFRLDRRAPWYLTRPINTAAIRAADRGTDPGPRYYPHLLPTLYPQQGHGPARFPSRDGDSAGFRSAPASVAPAGGAVGIVHEGFPASLDPEGRDVAQEGAYEILNSGPRGAAGADPPPVGAEPVPIDENPQQKSFPFSTDGGVTARHGVSFWITPRELGDQVIYDLSADDPERNRISMRILEGELLLEVLDEAGLDPEPRATATSPELTAGAWRIPLQELPLRPDVPLHINVTAFGNQPGQLSLLVDGVPRGDPDFVTYLTSRLQTYELGDPNRLPPEFRERFVDIRVESTEEFPEQGILRIGLELLEYTSKDSNTFFCEFRDSMGGRTARMLLSEYRPEIPVDAEGRPLQNVEDLGGGVNLDVAPAHEVGTAVELYGYAIPLYRDSFVQVGDAALADALGPFAVARVINRNAPTIDVVGPSPPTPPETRTIGVGLDVDTTDDIELGDPLTNLTYPPPGQVDQRVPSAFPASGGYALLVQRRVLVQFTVGNLSTSELIGGVEVIRYSARQGNRLTGIQRRVTLPGIDTNDPTGFFGSRNRFVSDWEPGLAVGNGREPMRDFPSYLLYVVPISIAVSGDVTDPSTLGYSEWVQIYRPDDEASTEWVRYNLIMDGRHLVRANSSAWNRAHAALTHQFGGRDLLDINRLGGSVGEPAGARDGYGQLRSTMGYIGYLDEIEADFPATRFARNGLGFRGDPFTGTSSHAHGVNTRVLPVHRLEMDWGNYAALGGRTGRNDRVALVNGTGASGDSRPVVEWHSVNWSARRFGRDRTDRAPDEPLGPYPFQLVGFKERVGAALFQGPASRDDFIDTRFADRLVKFPSGELPAAFADTARFGGSLQGDGRDMAGTVDEVIALQHRAADLVLDEPMAESANEFLVRPDLMLTGFGPLVVSGDVTERYPESGGLVAIDGEIVAFTTRDNGRFQVAQDGRGLLHTEQRAHDMGARVRFLTHVPAAILTDGVTAYDDRLLVDDLGALPRWGGTVLLGRTELVHYTWTRGNTVLEMPRVFDRERDDRQGRGLFRGRFGTQARSAVSGEVVIGFPFRYWDRHQARADDPEMAYLQLTHRVDAPVLFSEFGWQEEAVYPEVDVHAALRVDGLGSFADMAEQSSELFYTEGDDQDRAWQLFKQGSLFEARFFTVYRAGAFDAVNFLGLGWKTAPLVNAVLVGYEGQARILEEVTGR